MIPKIEKILDLSQPVYHSCPAWPTYDFTVVDYEAKHATHGFIAERLNLNTHTATHVDAPYHMIESGKKLDELDLNRYAGRGIVMDLRKAKDWEALDPKDRGITAADLEACHADVQEGDVVLLDTGWSHKRAVTKEYLYQWPFITRDGAQWLVDHKVKTVGIDGLSVGGWPEGTGLPPHEVLLGAEVLVIEEVYIDPALYEEPEWFMVVLPLLLKGAGGSPTRVVAIKFA